MRDDHCHGHGHEDAASQIAQQVARHVESLWLEAALDKGKEIILIEESRRAQGSAHHKSPGTGRPGVEITRILQIL